MYLFYLSYDELFEYAQDIGCDPIYLVDSKEELINMIYDYEYYDAYDEY